MRILVYGMQSSGASLFTFFLAQKPNTFAIIDIWGGDEIPKLEDIKCKDIIVKYIITKEPLSNHIMSLKPHKKILFIRNPVDNYYSLNTKKYARDIDEKFKILEQIFQKKENFDLVIFYEEFIFNPDKVLKKLKRLGFVVKKDFFEFKRTPEDISKFNIKHCIEFKKFKNKWLFGNIHFDNFKKDNIKTNKGWVFKTRSNTKRIEKICPSLYKFYWKNHKDWLKPHKINLLKSTIYTKMYYINKNIDRKIGLVGVLLKQHFPKLYFTLKKLQKSN